MAITKATSSVLADNAALNNLNAGASIAFTKPVSVSGNLTVDTNTLFVDSVNNRVGIGTNNPQQAIDFRPITFNVSQSGGIRFDNTSGTWPCGIYIRSDGSGGPRLSLDAPYQTNTLNLYDNNVGIGTLTPTAKLDVVGSIKASGNLTVDTNTLFVDATNDKVGIGTTTPNEKLTVVGNISASGTVIASNYNPAANVAAFLADPTSAKLAAAVTDKTGTGALVFGTSPTISSPTINTAITLNATTYTYGTGAANAHRTALSINNVDNTSDANKPISAATQSALNLKSDISNPVRTTLTGNGSTSVFAIGGAGSLSNPSALIVAIDGALQEPSVDYTVSGGNITFTDPLASGAKAVVIAPTNTLQVGELIPSDGSVTSAKLAPNLTLTNTTLGGTTSFGNTRPTSTATTTPSTTDLITMADGDARYLELLSPKIIVTTPSDLSKISSGTGSSSTVARGLLSLRTGTSGVGAAAGIALTNVVANTGTMSTAVGSGLSLVFPGITDGAHIGLFYGGHPASLPVLLADFGNTGANGFSLQFRRNGAQFEARLTWRINGTASVSAWESLNVGVASSLYRAFVFVTSTGIKGVIYRGGSTATYDTIDYSTPVWSRTENFTFTGNLGNWNGVTYAHSGDSTFLVSRFETLNRFSI
jgi:hypothetical protein